MYVPTQAHGRFLREVRSTMHTSLTDLQDKRRFNAVCLRHRLPTATILGEFEAGQLAAWYGAGPLLPRSDLFAKEAFGQLGKGATLWTYVRDDDAWRAAEGPLMKDAELLEYLARCSAETPIILQHRISNHPVLARLSSGALCTVE